MKEERGFTLVETMCALVVLALCMLVIAELWQASSSMERKSELELAISRTAVSVLENWRAQSTVPIGTSTQILPFGDVKVTEVRAVTKQGDLAQISLTYSWQEGGRTFAQNWASLHR